MFLMLTPESVGYYCFAISYSYFIHTSALKNSPQRAYDLPAILFSFTNLPFLIHMLT